MDKVRIFLVRHGESQGNVDKSLHKIMPDHEIALTTDGMGQAQEAGQKLKDYLKKHQPAVAVDLGGMFGGLISNLAKQKGIKDTDLAKTNELLQRYQQSKARLWYSPYRRTRETARIISGVANKFISDAREHILLCEQQFGLFDGLTEDESNEKFPEEYKSFQHAKKYNGKFWARFPMGESPFDAACRIHQAFGTFKRDEEDKNINDIIVICHGAISKLFTMMWLHKSPEWFQAEPTCGNCGIRLIEDHEDKGYIFGGYAKGNEWNYDGNKYDRTGS